MLFPISNIEAVNTDRELVYTYRCNSFIVDLRHQFTVRNMNEIPVFVQSSELSNIT